MLFILWILSKKKENARLLVPLVSEALTGTLLITCPFIFECFRTAFRAMLEKRNSDSESDWDSLSEAPPLQTSCQTGTDDVILQIRCQTVTVARHLQTSARQVRSPAFTDQLPDWYRVLALTVPAARQVSRLALSHQLPDRYGDSSLTHQLPDRYGDYSLTDQLPDTYGGYTLQTSCQAGKKGRAILQTSCQRVTDVISY